MAKACDYESRDWGFESLQECFFFIYIVTKSKEQQQQQKWPQRDSNPQPLDLESNALPLRHGVLLVTGLLFGISAEIIRWWHLCRICWVICIVRSYHGETTGSHPNSEVKHHWACSVLRWGTTRESQVVYVFVGMYALVTLASLQWIAHMGGLWGFESFDVKYPPIV